MRTKMPGMRAAILPVDPASVVERLRRGIAEAGLDCNCRVAANDLLDPAGLEEELVRRSSGLADARKMRDAIVIVLALLCCRPSPTARWTSPTSRSCSGRGLISRS